MKTSIILSALLFLFCCPCNQPAEQEQQSEQPGPKVTGNAHFTGAVSTYREWKISEICIDGHAYYLTTSYQGGGIAPKLNNDGSPVHCQ